MKNKLLKSIKSQLVFLLSVSAIVGILLTTAVIFTYTYHENKKQTLNASYLMTSIMAENLPASIVFDDDQTATKIITTLGLDESINGAFIYLENKEIFAEYIKEGIDQNLIRNKSSDLIKSSLEQSIEYIDSRFIITASPINFQNEKLAKLVIVADTSKLKDLLFNQLLTMLAVAFFAILLVGLWATRLQKTFTDPIFQLLEKMNLVTKKHKYDVSVVTQRKDEFQHLFSGFNEMIATINERTEELNLAKKAIEEAHHKTQDSIKYSSLIQKALIPDKEVFQNFFVDHFRYWQPKDIVGGDIFFFDKLQSSENEAILFVIDCTGHGVPGALVTMLVKAVERQIMTEISNNPEKQINPGEILSLFNKNLKQFLKQEENPAANNIGFDGAIIYINKQFKIIKYAGSNTPLYKIYQEEITEYKPDKKSVAHTRTKLDFEFTEHEIKYQTGSAIYITTDGYLDQIGGEKGFSFGRSRFKKLIKRLHKQEMLEQKQRFKQELLDYQQGYERNDDVTLVGFKL